MDVLSYSPYLILRLETAVSTNNEERHRLTQIQIFRSVQKIAKRDY